MLLLRGPQTPGELKSRTERLHPFADLEAIEDALDELARRDEPLAQRARPEPGQKEARVREILSDGAGDGAAAPRRRPDAAGTGGTEPAVPRGTVAAPKPRSPNCAPRSTGSSELAR